MPSLARTTVLATIEGQEIAHHYRRDNGQANTEARPFGAAAPRTDGKPTPGAEVPGQVADAKFHVTEFRGFEKFWEIPAGSKTAVHGKWVLGPGDRFFEALSKALVRLPFIAEDLGYITREVQELRDRWGFPGMRVLQFAFGDESIENPHKPFNFINNCVAYTGTHDNDTTRGWWQTAGKAVHNAVNAYVGPVDNSPVWPLIRVLESSVAEVAIVPAQDLLELGSEARMNTPAVAAGNWSWRAPVAAWTPELAGRLAELAEVTDRDNDPLGEPEEVNEG